MYDTGIIGGGLAGLLTARALLARGIEGSEVVVYDAADLYRGSDNPGAMLHPFPGRLLRRKSDLMMLAYLSASSLLDETAIANDDVVAFRGPMVRPLLDGDVGRAFLQSWQDHRANYPDKITDRRVERAELEGLGPFGETFDEAIVYEPAYSVDMAGWLAQLKRWLQEKGVTFRAERVEELERRLSSWAMHTDARSDAAENCVLAVGPVLARWFPELNIQPTGGALLVVDAGGLELSAAVSAGGHIAPLGDGRWVAGATWWHDDEFERIPDDDAAEAVIERVRHLIPVIGELERLQVWRGVRAVHANDRRPIVGEVPGHAGLYVCSGFGSKGLLWGAWTAKLLSLGITRGGKMPHLVSTERLARKWWLPGPLLHL
jgi:glycine/D-amino acid oxidase-like deaminating enzyme